MGFLGKAGGRYRLTPEARAFLLPGAPGGLASNLLYQAKLVPDWSRLAETVRTGRPARGLVEILRSDPSFVRAYLEGMDEIARRPAAELARALDLSGALEMLDAGGGPGTYLRALLNAEPALRGTLLDLPEALRAARPFFAGWPGRRRVEFRAGDYRRTSFGRAGFDLVLLSHITHDEGEAANRALLAKAFQALRPGGQAVVHDFMVEPDRTRPLFGALFSVHMLTCTLEGRTYSRAEYESWLGKAGFKDLRAIELCAGSPNASTALVGRRPL